jgi:hypothetical protein
MVGDDVLQAYARLSTDPVFRVIVDDLQDRWKAAHEAMEVATDPWSMGRAQGCSILIGELLELAQGGARKALERKASRTVRGLT